MNSHRPTRAFTLVELLVVISIIVILLALLVPGLNKALKYAEQSNCAANQRNIAQVLTGYSLDNRYMLPPSVATWTETQADPNAQGDDLWITSGDFAYAMDYRATKNTATVDAGWRGPAYVYGRGDSRLRRFVVAAASVETGGGGGVVAPLGLGILPALGAMPTTELGKMANCPSLNTKSSAPTSKYGMDERYAIADGTTRTTGSPNGAGGSYIVDPNETRSRIVGSYNYRGASYAVANGGTAVIQYSQIGPTFVLTTDFIDVRFGRKYHHKDGYNVSYGDGHCEFYNDPPEGDGYGKVEKLIPRYNANNPEPIDGISSRNPDNTIVNAQAANSDEKIYQYMSAPPK